MSREDVKREETPAGRVTSAGPAASAELSPSTGPVSPGESAPSVEPPAPAGLDTEEAKTYDRLRRKVQEAARAKVGPRYSKAVEVLLFLPDFVVLIFRLLKDPRVPAAAKVKLGLFTVYLASPIDIVPDFIPVLGQMDDLVGAVLVVRDILKSTPQEVVLEHWSGQDDVMKTISVVLDVAGELLGKKVLSAIAKYFAKEK